MAWKVRTGWREAVGLHGTLDGRGSAVEKRRGTEKLIVGGGGAQMKLESGMRNGRSSEVAQGIGGR